MKGCTCVLGKNTCECVCVRYVFVCVRACECMTIHVLGKKYKILSYDYPAMQSLNYAFLHLIVYSKHRYSVQGVNTIYPEYRPRGTHTPKHDLISHTTVFLCYELP